jgi:hypothetical protein
MALTLSCSLPIKKLLQSTRAIVDHYGFYTPMSLPNKEDLVEANHEDYPNVNTIPIIGSIQYSASMCRPDLALSASMLGSERHSPAVAGMKNILKGLSYIGGTHDLGISAQTEENDPLQFEADSDSDWAGDLKISKDPTCRSRSGGVIKFATFAVWWLTKLQSTVALSSSEAELIALSETCKRLVWLRRMFSEMGFSQGMTKVHATILPRSLLMPKVR